jgi:hypothetical protein
LGIFRGEVRKGEKDSDADGLGKLVVVIELVFCGEVRSGKVRLGRQARSSFRACRRGCGRKAVEWEVPPSGHG